MPGLYGFIKSENLASSELFKVANAMMLYDHFVQDAFFEDSQIAASRTHLGKIGEQTSPQSLGHIKIWVEGEAYNQSEIVHKLSLTKLGLADILIEAYSLDKLDDLLKVLDGYFCAVIYDSERQEVKLISDRYGMRMLYWYEHNGNFVWGSEVKAILACDGIDRTIDKNSYECFMELGYLLGEHTWFEHIKLLNPATVLTYDLKRKVSKQYYYWSWSDIKPSNFTFDQAVDELGNRFIKAVERRFNPDDKKIGIALSGGLDSRAIFAAINHLYPEFSGWAYTFGIPECDDIKIAQEVIEHTRNWEHEVYYFSDKNWFQPRLEKVWNTDGMQDMMHMHGGEFINKIASKINITLNGYSGDVIFGGGFLGRIPHDVRITTENSKGFYQKFTQLANVDSDFYNINKVEPNLQMNRVRRFTAMGTVNGLIALEHRKPFFDNACVELIYSIPDEYRSNNRLYSEMLKKFFPDYFLDIPWQKTGLPVGLLNKPSFAERAYNKIKRHISSWLGVKNIKEYAKYSAWIRSPEIAAYLTELFSPKTALYKQLTSKDFLNEYLFPHLKNKSLDNSNQILRAATIEIYLRKINGVKLPDIDIN